VQGMLFEKPQVAAGAGRVFDAAGVRDHVDMRSGDFFAHIPAGGMPTS
jgi:hypothetical protein